MPARTLSEDSELLSPLRYAPFVHSPPLLDHPERHRADYAMHAYPPNVAHTHRSPPRASHRDYVYPTAPPMQRTEWRMYPIVPPQWAVNPSLASGWLPHPPFAARVSPMAPPPALMHKVWLVDCKSCSTFLTNRGMKAVLLLHPSVPLYSTDAIPINCSAQAMTAEATASSSSRAQATSANSAERPRPIARTCDCLTQTLWCHGCGTAVGYMIVTPCVRCTSSVAPNNRSTNGHRFVFYSAEIVASERHHVPGEGGIVPQAQAAETTDMSPAPADLSLQRPQHTPSPTRMRGHPSRTPNSYSTRRDSPSPTSPRSPSSPRSDATSSPPPLVPITPTRHPAEAGIPPLREGDVVFWHHLIRSGEIPAVMDDPRARAPAKEAADAGAPDAKGAGRDDATASRKMVAGRYLGR
ncbi:hypothetical protein PHLGIDRAFT_18909 [Phlebiopsis gigantea 11061_1 CR5-6]|uniref:Protein FAM72 n=1 Tax=Phlebiopsis gigantea (strain 11061_1 CR5-6) TaxID=745531 RepID=A0A0C3S9N3_PHLG1|nr:hypothetical protein PHLGIDRAFT_18909 [Phlebiopsis gigantea 11061_1 CR5-6]